MEKKKNVRNQLIVAWLLLLAFMPMNMMKTFHHHDHASEQTTAKANHSHENCQICQFVLSPFLAAETSEFTLTETCIKCEPVTYLKESYITALNSYYLRGPPELLS